MPQAAYILSREFGVDDARTTLGINVLPLTAAVEIAATGIVPAESDLPPSAT